MTHPGQGEPDQGWRTRLMSSCSSHFEVAPGVGELPGVKRQPSGQTCELAVHRQKLRLKSCRAIRQHGVQQTQLSLGHSEYCLSTLDVVLASAVVADPVEVLDKGSVDARWFIYGIDQAFMGFSQSRCTEREARHRAGEHLQKSLALHNILPFLRQRTASHGRRFQARRGGSAARAAGELACHRVLDRRTAMPCPPHGFSLGHNLLESCPIVRGSASLQCGIEHLLGDGPRKDGTEPAAPVDDGGGINA